MFQYAAACFSAAAAAAAGARRRAQCPPASLEALQQESGLTLDFRQSPTSFQQTPKRWTESVRKWLPHVFAGSRTPPRVSATGGSLGLYEELIDWFAVWWSWPTMRFGGHGQHRGLQPGILVV